MFVGEFLCLLVYFAKTMYIRSNKKEDPDAPPEPPGGLITTPDGRVLKTKINPLLLAIPASFDVIGSTMMNIALTLISASIYQMLRGMLVIVTAFMSIIFLKAKLYRHHWTSLTVLFIGVFMVGLSSFLSDNSKDGKDPKTQALGLGIIVLAQIFAGSLLIVEEKILGSY
jgi:drug/metabolite transporter (DMT)-like permease